MGRPIALIDVTECHKRDYPHCHLLTELVTLRNWTLQFHLKFQTKIPFHFCVNQWPSIWCMNPLSMTILTALAWKTRTAPKISQEFLNDTSLNGNVYPRHQRRSDGVNVLESIAKTGWFTLIKGMLFLVTPVLRRNIFATSASGQF